MRPAAGLRLGGRYELRSRIAVGGMGEVWLTRDLALDRAVATKVLRPELAGDERFLADLRAEARRCARLEHPNIAALYDYGEEADGSGYLVMELINGETLSDVLAREGLLPLGTLLPVLAQAARALHAAHVSGVVHRDVKPSNILLTRDGRVKITDFGVAVGCGEPAVAPRGTVLGSAQYLAPEQVLGRAATPAGDVYGLGVVGFEAATGRRPFTGPSAVDVANAHVNERVPDLPDSLPEDLRALLRQMLDKEPRRRPPSAAAVARRVERMRKEWELEAPFRSTVEESADPDDGNTWPAPAHDGRELVDTASLPAVPVWITTGSGSAAYRLNGSVKGARGGGAGMWLDSVAGVPSPLQDGGRTVGPAPRSQTEVEGSSW